VRVGVLGCMAERLKTKLIETDKLIDVVCGPDAVCASSPRPHPPNTGSRLKNLDFKKKKKTLYAHAIVPRSAQAFVKRGKYRSAECQRGPFIGGNICRHHPCAT